MNEIKILILSFLAFLVAGCGMPRKLQTETTSTPTITIEDFAGVWLSKNFGEDEIMYRSLELHLEKDNTKENALRGWHCARIRGGRQIDCTEYNEEPRISGYLKDDTVYLHFINNWEDEVEAELYFDKSSQNLSDMIWELVRYEYKLVSFFREKDTLRNLTGSQVILPDESIPIKQVRKSQNLVNKINAMELIPDTLHNRLLEKYSPRELLEVIYYDEKERIRKYSWDDQCHDASYGGTSISAYYNEKGELIYIFYASGSNCESAREEYYIHKERIVDFKADLYCDCCEYTNDMLTEEEVNNRRPQIGSALTKTMAWENPLTGFINIKTLLAMLNSKERHGAYLLHNTSL